MPAVRQSVSAVLAAVFLLATACQQRQETANAANAVQQSVVPDIPLPAPEPPIQREQLLLAAMKAASAYATGADDSAIQKELIDRKFEFRIRFGCADEAQDSPNAPFYWKLDHASGALKVRVTPRLSADDPPVKALAGEAFETVEGFWVRRPWLLTPTCPVTDVTPADSPNQPTGQSPGASANSGAAATAATSREAAVRQTLGIAQFFTANGPRTMRRSGRPYEATKKLAAGDVPRGGFDFVLTGRLAPLPNGRIIACTHSPVEERPSCIVSVEFGKVSIERADTHEQLALWSPG
jgi:hypothetical protein